MNLGKFTNRKGISSIVGGIFFLVLMTAGFTVYYVALDSQSQMLDTQKIIADSEIAKIQEDFAVAASSDPDDNRLSLQVANTGNNPIEIADIWIINKTDAGEPAERYDLDYADVSIPVGHTGNILENTVLYLDPEVYDIKVVSSIGIIKTIEFDVNGGSNILKAQMVAIPQDVRFGENVTVAIIVTNVGTDPIKEVKANDLEVDPNQCQDPPNGIFLGPTDLLPSQSTMFFWDCVLDPPVGNTITLTGNATGKLQGAEIYSNDATDSVIVRDFSSGGGTIILEQELLNRPEIFMVVPSPYGDDPDEYGLWGVNVVNPTPAPMEVSKVTITILPSRPQMQDAIWDPKNPNPPGCAHTSISPTPDAWSCPVINQLMWKDFANPIIIPPYSVFPFLTTVEPGSLAGAGDIMETIIVQANVFTTLGQFGKTGYGSSMVNDNSALVSAFLSNTLDSTPPNIHSYKLGLPAQDPVTFYATLADLDSSQNFQIDTGSRLIINVPRDWTGVSYPDDLDFSISDSTYLGQTQIIGVLNVDIVNGGKSLEFTATPPCVQQETMYVMYILADGTVSDGTTEQIAIGPLAEVILQVVPNGPCT